MTQNIDVREMGVYRGRSTVKKFLLMNVNDMFDKIHRAFGVLTQNYQRILHSEPPATKEAIHKSRTSWLAARELLVEASMAAEYFNFMLADLERSRESMDLMTMKVPDYSAPVDNYLCPSEEMRRLASVQRTYHSSKSHRTSFETAV